MWLGWLQIDGVICWYHLIFVKKGKGERERELQHFLCRHRYFIEYCFCVIVMSLWRKNLAIHREFRLEKKTRWKTVHVEAFTQKVQWLDTNIFTIDPIFLVQVCLVNTVLYKQYSRPKYDNCMCQIVPLRSHTICNLLIMPCVKCILHAKISYSFFTSLSHLIENLKICKCSIFPANDW